MRLVMRFEDRVNPHDDLVLRAGGGDVDALTRSAIENARDYEHLVATTPTEEGVEPGPLDLYHFDIVVDSADGT